MAYIYIATNDTLWFNDGGHFTPLIKIGYTSSPDIDRRMEQLNRTTSAAGRFVKFASYEVAPIPGRMPDRLVHSIIQSINPNLRLTESKEYFIWEPESAYRFFESMARLHGCEDKLVRYDGRDPVAPQSPHQTRTANPPVNFRLLGIPEGAVLHYKADPSVTCTVCGERKIIYEGRVCSMTALAKELRGRSDSVNGALWFTWEGRTLADRWQEYCAEHIAASPG
ncbi:MAG: GIY-YIG nuclease family protein [Aristaeellaceae bacterium]